MADIDLLYRIRRSRTARAAGAVAEEAAARMLRQSGLRILARNFRSRFGEIDLVARDGDMVVFVEVRKRSSAAYGGAGESITRGKQRRIIAAAKSYLRRLAATPCRFDAVLISSDGDVIEWLRDAFTE